MKTFCSDRFRLLAKEVNRLEIVLLSPHLVSLAKTQITPALNEKAKTLQ